MAIKTVGFLAIAGFLVAPGDLKAQSFGRIETYAGTATGGTTNNGVPATSANLRYPSDVAIDPRNGDVYLTDSGNHTVRAVTRSTNLINTVAGTGTQGYNGDNIPATTAQLNNPYGVVLDATGNLYISDTDNARVRRVDAATRIITTVAGNGVAGFSCDNCPATNAQINTPNQIALDSTGRYLYIAGTGSNRIRKVDLVANIITTIAGNGQADYSGDNDLASRAKLNNPRGVVVDPVGNVYIADFANNRVRRIDTAGIITTYAGNGKSTGPSGYNGPALSVRINGPTGLALDRGGNLYVSDNLGHVVLQISAATPDHITTLVAGNGQSGNHGDGGPATDAAVGSPRGIAFDPTGRLYIASYAADVIRVVYRGGPPSTVEIVSGSPQRTPVGTAFSQQLTVAVKDAFGNPVTGVDVTFAAPGSGASASLGATTTVSTDIDGQASIAATANTKTGSYTVTARSGVSTTASFSLTNDPGPVDPANGIRFVVQPSNTAAGSPIAPAVTVQLKDSYGNPVAGDTVSVSITTAGTLLGGIASQPTDANGTATFNDLVINRAATYTLSAAAASNGAGAVSNQFTISPGTASKVKISSGDGQSSVVNTAFAGPLKVLVTDANNNPIQGATVTFTAPTGSGSPGATFASGTTATATTDASGIAGSPVPNSNTKAGAFQVTASLAGGSFATFSLTNTPAPPSNVIFTTQPGDTAAGAGISPVSVRLDDAYGNHVLAGITVLMQLAGTGPQFSPTPTQTTDANGTATFNSLVVTKAGTYQLGAADTGVARGTSNTFTIRAGAPAAIRETGGTPQTAAVNTPFPVLLTVEVKDSLGNPVSGAPVVFTTPGTGASATLSPPTGTTDANGVAKVTATANSISGGAYTVTATAGVGLNVAFSLTNTSGAPGQIAFVNQPAMTAAGDLIPAITVRVTDGSSNAVSGVSVTMEAVPGPGLLQGAAPQTTDGNGQATFSTMHIDAAGSYVLQAVSGNMSALSLPFPITASLALLKVTPVNSPQASVVNTAFPAALQVRVADQFGNPAGGVVVTFTANPVDGAGADFAGGGTPLITTDPNGVATAPALTSNTKAGAFTVMATAGAATAVFNLTNTPGPTILKFGQQPGSSTTAGVVLSPVTLRLVDQFDNPVRTQDVTVNLALDSATVPILGTTSVRTDPNGIAAFNDLHVEVAGGYQFFATAAAIESATSNSFQITPDLTTLRIVSKGGTPQSAAISTAFASNLRSLVTDRFGNRVANVPVTFTAPATGAGATLGGSATFTINSNAQGRASSPIPLANNVAGGPYTVTASISGAAVGYLLTNIAGAPATISFLNAIPKTAAGSTIGPVTVKVVDSGGNPISSAVVTMAADGPGSLNGTITRTTNASGEALFDDLNIGKAGVYVLEASSGEISKDSDSFQITAAVGNTITAFNGAGQSAAVKTAYALKLKASVQDSFGNPVPKAEVTFTVVPGGADATFAPPTTVITDDNGIADSPVLTAGSQVGALQVNATTPNVQDPAVFQLANIAGAASRLAFIVQPTSTVTGAAIAPAPSVQLQDASGNPVVQPGVAITLQVNPINSRFRALSGVITQNTDGSGIASFAGLSLAQAGTYQLHAQSADVASATSDTFTISVNTAAGIQATGGTPQSATASTVFALPLQATVTDANGNPVSGVPVTFEAPVSGAGATFGGHTSITAITNAQGIAGVVATANALTGTYSVVATVPSVAGSATFSLTNLAPPVTSLAFVQQPGNATIGQVLSPPVTVQVRDSGGNPVNLSGIAVIMSLASGSGSLFGTQVQLTGPTGLATFNDLFLGRAGPKTLRASSAGQAPAVSNTFQVAAGSPATVSAYAGSFQATQVLQPFPATLQAQVKDLGGNPVSGVQVTFAVPTSGPSGTFAGSSVVTTDSNGIASAPGITANGVPGAFVAFANAAGVATPAVFSLTNIPAPSGNLQLDSMQLSFGSEIGQPAPGPQTVHITSTGASTSWTASSSAAWLTANPTSGTTPGQVLISVNPSGLALGNYSGTILFTTPNGGQSSLYVAYTIADRPTLLVAPPVLVFTTEVSSSRTFSAPTPQSLKVTSTSRAIAYAVSTQVTTPSGGNWLSAAPAQGQTPGAVQVSVNPGTLAAGVYTGSVSLTPTETGIGVATTPIVLVVNGSQQPTLGPRIDAVVNSASYQPHGAPGAIMTIFGRNLSDAVYQATAYPLPLKLGPTSVTVDGVAAPLFYVSPTQINFQMLASESGTPVIAVNTGLLRAASGGYPASVAQVAPGLYLWPGTRAAALNGDLSLHTAATPQPAGATVALFITGQGEVTPPVADGAAAPLAPLSTVIGNVVAAIGGKPAKVTFAGLAPLYAGLAQINVEIPAGLRAGDQPAFVTINGVPSNVGLVTVK